MLAGGGVRAIIGGMIETTYRDLAEFGLILINPDEPAFNLWFEDIGSIPEPFGPNIERVPDRAAILENQSESAVITLGYIWRYTTTNEEPRTRSCLNLGSSRQMDVLTGREQATRDLFSFILPGSRRLITEEGMFGDNRDVLAQQPPPARGDWVFSRGGCGRAAGMDARDPDRDVVRIELALDVAIFADGLCVGPDEFGLRASLIEQMERQKEVADQIVRALRDGATRGRIFDVLQPLARHWRRVPSAPPGAMDTERRHHSLLWMFARSAVNQLLNAEDATLLAWFEAAAAISPMRLHPPGSDLPSAPAESKHR